MSIDAYLNFDGNCREAVLFYAKAFKLEEPEMMTFGQMHGQEDFQNEADKNLIMHARLQISGSNVMFSDVFPGMTFNVGNNITLALVTQNKEELEYAYQQLKEGGDIMMALQETAWSKCYGMLTDKFGVQWQFNLGE